VSETDRDGVMTPAGDEARPRRSLRLIVTLLAALALAVAAPAASLAEDGDGDGSGRGGDNLAQAVNEEDGSSVFDFAFSIRRVAGEVVDNQNMAVAYASCVECQTVAIALQIVLVEGSPDRVTPTNLAIALNEECAACTTVALAYQFVVGRGGPVRFTAEGRRQLARIRREFQRLGRSDLSAKELIARAEELKAQVADVLANELVPVHDGEDGEEDGGDDERFEGGEYGGGRSGGSGASGDDQGGAAAGAGSNREPTGGERPSGGGESGDSPGAGDSGASPNGGSSGGGESPASTPPAGSGSASGASP
jgi:putative peptide zinc metalloprotease protein